ncbi:biotin--[acetyl-CoA-carboxylase] ligase [Solitalea koreensis]|uniref:BirA family transcriptional regulator, biotin operon repressor / biotin-[acetyl-CoA-carboxylase] ligase n=1 Tax=Solitalea koreensis TaxID=543615 RepID=A0A521CLC4_9SPHI|nr:biotin--[acetyl-CoA-carboxylase] ligase [Solitalea koreensis]SMO60249.1 BirA family transcriptional regulator, biotin operon repressor / biotin-[acetyl-CoA-carboxylase] ligase [Solitalea koreensis]
MQFTTNSALFFGQNLITLSEVDSTNNYLKQLLANTTPLPEGTAIMAENQFQGRGQMQNKWFAEPGKNLTLSFLACPSFVTVGEQFNLNKAVSLGVTDFVGSILGNRVKIKWPNDIFYGDTKLGGILIENFLSGSYLKQSVIGIGLNINQDHFPDGINAISFKTITGKDHQLIPCFNALSSALEARYLQLRSGNLASINTDYLGRLFRIGERHLYRSVDDVFEGEIIGINSLGQLQVYANEEVKEFSFKEIEFVL